MASPRLTEPAIQRTEPHGNGNRHQELDHGAVREQVDRILASPVFRNSRRNSSLLRHVVERALEGRPEELKERTIGVDVFARAADYDTNTDHVVRSVAGEVRRRLAQYYLESGRETELRIDLQAGSYIPQFRMPAERFALAAPVLDDQPFPAPDRTADRWFKPALRQRSIAMAAGVLVVTAVASILLVRLFSPRTALDKFWAPFLASPNPAMLCFGGGGQANPASDQNLALSISEYEHLPFRRMHTLDAIAVADLAGFLQAARKPYRIANRANSTSYRDLQSGPFVLVGGMNNQWTLRLTGGLRFSFARQPNGARVEDKQNPSNAGWAVDFTTPLSQFSRDYAIVSRVRDAKTEQSVVVAAGIGSWGTLAAGEFVTRAEHLARLEKLAPSHWEHGNLQVVLATDVIRGSSGPPIVLAAHFWQ
jgi:hypothetical protein